MRAALILLIASGVFLIWPGIDLAVTALFYDGTGFAARKDSLIEGIRLALYGAEVLAAVGAFVLMIVTLWRGGQILGLDRRGWLFAFGVFALGPGLLVNGLLKRVWGRARPDAVTEFGGQMQFTPAWVISDQCPANCSFVSGEMAGAVALAILLGLLARRWRGLWVLVWAVPLFTAWQRVAVGRHFLSDVVLSALMVAVIAVVLARLIWPQKTG